MTRLGKAKVARNAWKSGLRSAVKAEMHELRAELNALARIQGQQAFQGIDMRVLRPCANPNS